MLVRKVYADHAATTRVHPAVAEVMARVLTEDFGNPSSVHAFGRTARKHVEWAREQVARLIGARPSEIFFTSGGTEADNWALRGAMEAARGRGRHLITTAIEHHAVLDCARQLEREGWEVTVLPVEPVTGFVRAEDLVSALRPDTVLVSVMLANNEIGTVQDIAGLVAAVKAARPDVVFHTDAVQAAGQIPVDVGALGVDLLTLSAHKIYGPKGVGALYVRKGVPFSPMLYGGGQERGHRPGTENAAGIAGFGKAAELARLELEARAEHARQLRDRFVAGVLERIPGTHVNGPDPATQAARRTPGNASVSFEGVEAETLLMRLDMEGIACSAGSACTAGSVEPSHVLKAIGLPRARAAGTLRFSFGQDNTPDDVDYMLEVLSGVVEAIRGIPVAE